MAYSKEKLKSNGNKVFPCFKPFLNFCCWTTYKALHDEPFKLLNDLCRGRKQSVEFRRNFFHSYLIYCWVLQKCRTLEGQGFFLEPESNPSTSLTPPNTLIYMSTHNNYAFCPSWLIQFQKQPALFITRIAVHCGLKYQHWPMNRTLTVDQKCFQWLTEPI